MNIPLAAPACPVALPHKPPGRTEIWLQSVCQLNSVETPDHWLNWYGFPAVWTGGGDKVAQGLITVVSQKVGSAKFFENKKPVGRSFIVSNKIYQKKYKNNNDYDWIDMFFYFKTKKGYFTKEEIIYALQQVYEYHRSRYSNKLSYIKVDLRKNYLDIAFL